jgi:WD40 repeat protein
MRDSGIMHRGLGVVFAVLIAGYTAGVAAGGTITQLPLSAFGGMAVDGAHQRVFVSGGAGTSSIVVLDFTGAIVKTITGQGGATGMVVDESSGTLYVALRDNTSITKIDTATLAETSRMSVAPISLPRQLALAGGKLWFGYGCASTAGIGSINLDGSSAKAHSMGAGYCPVLAATATTGRLASGDTGISPTTLYLYDISTDPPTLVKSVWSPGGASDLNQLVFSPDESRLLSASNNPGAVQAFNVSDLSLAATYPLADGHPNSVAISDDGAFVAAAAGHAWYDPDIYVFPAGETTPVRQWDFTSTTKVMVERGLAFSPDSSKLFAVSTNDTTGRLDFRVLTNPTQPLLSTETSLTVSASRVTYGTSLTLRAHVTAAKTGSMSFYKTPYGGSRTLVKTVAINSLGNASISTKPAARTLYTAEFTGNDKYDSSTSAGRTVYVRARTTVRLRRWYARSGIYKLFRAGTRPLVTGTVAPNHAGSPLRFVAQRYYAGAWRLTATVTFTITSAGSVSAELLRTTRGGTYRVRTIFGGDADHLGSRSRWAYLKVT